MQRVTMFIVFFLVYGALHFLFTERKRKAADGRAQSMRRALLRTCAVSAFAGVVFIVLREIINSL